MIQGSPMKSIWINDVKPSSCTEGGSMKRTTISVTLHVLYFDNICHFVFSVIPRSCRATINPFCPLNLLQRINSCTEHLKRTCYNLKVCLQGLKIDKTRTISPLNSPHSAVQDTESQLLLP